MSNQGDGVDFGITTGEQFQHFVFWAVSRHPAAEFSNDDVMRIILSEFPHRVDESRQPNKRRRAFQSIPDQRDYAAAKPKPGRPTKLGIRSVEHAEEVLRRIDEKVWLRGSKTNQIDVAAAGLALGDVEGNLTPDAERLLRQLVQMLESGTVIPGEPQTYPLYSQVHDALGLELRGPTYGVSLKHQGLEDLAKWILGRGFPALTGIVVDGVTLEPHRSYFQLHGHNQANYNWWRQQISDAVSFNWKPYLSGDPELVGDTAPPETDIASDIASPPPRVLTTEYRILRDTELARRIKRLHEYRCQICGERIELPDGSFYAEAHHVQPLGQPHGGVDDARNVVCVCPNHHAMLDLGTMPLNSKKLFAVAGHTLGPKYIDYHNDVICSRWDG
jgi:hypothetical protein